MKKMFSSVVAFLSTFLVAGAALAEGGAGGANSNFGWYALGAGLAIGLGAAGCGMGQGRAASAALEGLARNPSSYNKVFVPFILGMALIESLAIFALVIAILVFGKIA
jgi:F-type H+-transporting ATPase subunit c